MVDQAGAGPLAEMARVNAANGRRALPRAESMCSSRPRLRGGMWPDTGLPDRQP